MAKVDRVPLLVVDDDPPIRKLLERVAKRAGFEVDSAKDGLQALEMLQRKQYEIAIVDLMMPRLSGYELVQKISAMSPRPCVIVATAMANSDVASLDDSMIRRVIRKPFDIETLAAALVETATELAGQRALADTGFAVAPAQVATIPVRPPASAEADAGAQAAEQQEPTAQEETSGEDDIRAD